jgi:hypothetical protein
MKIIVQINGLYRRADVVWDLKKPVRQELAKQFDLESPETEVFFQDNDSPLIEDSKSFLGVKILFEASDLIFEPRERLGQLKNITDNITEILSRHYKSHMEYYEKLDGFFLQTKVIETFSSMATIVP